MESMPLFFKMSLNAVELSVLANTRLSIIATIEKFGEYLKVQKGFQFTYLTGATFDLKQVISFGRFEDSKFSSYHLTLSIMKLGLVIKDNSFVFPKYLYEEVKLIEDSIRLLEAIRFISWKRFCNADFDPEFEFS